MITLIVSCLINFTWLKKKIRFHTHKYYHIEIFFFLWKWIFFFTNNKLIISVQFLNVIQTKKHSKKVKDQFYNRFLNTFINFLFNVVFVIRFFVLIVFQNIFRIFLSIMKIKPAHLLVNWEQYFRFRFISATPGYWSTRALTRPREWNQGLSLFHRSIGWFLENTSFECIIRIWSKKSTVEWSWRIRSEKASGISICRPEQSSIKRSWRTGSNKSSWKWLRRTGAEPSWRRIGAK